MLDANSQEELEYIRFLIKKYIPGLKSQGKELPTVMFEDDYPNEENDNSEN